MAGEIGREWIKGKPKSIGIVYGIVLKRVLFVIIMVSEMNEL